MEENSYNPQQDYRNSATNFQAVPSFEQYHHDHPDMPLNKIDSKRAETNYSCPDNYKMGSIRDNHIYIATTDKQHDIVADGEKFRDHQGGISGPSGYFSDQATVDACKSGDTLDNTRYNEMCQIAPYRNGGIEGIGDATYKPHVDCFEIARDALYRNYGTYDFNAAVAKCEANNHFGAGGGNQGYNPHISEMIDNGTLKHVPENSFSDPLVSKSEHNNPYMLTNSIVPEQKADKMYIDAQTRAQDCVKNNTLHPSYEARNNGYPLNPNPIASNTGHATPALNSNIETCGATLDDISPIPPPNRAEGIPAGADDLSSINQNAAEASNAVSNAAESGQNAAKSLTGGMV